MGYPESAAVLAPPRAIAARRDLQRLIDEDAPAGVISAAQEAIFAVEAGCTPRADTRDVLLSWSAIRQGQDRYGKPLDFRPEAAARL